MARRKPRFRPQPYKGHGPNDWSPMIHAVGRRQMEAGRAAHRAGQFIARMGARL